MADLARLNLWKSMSSMQPLQATQFNANMSVIEQVLNALNYDLETGNFNIQPSQVTNAMIDRATIDRLVVVTADIADASISNLKIDRATANRLSIIEADIADAAIATAKIRDAAITNAKIEDATITNAKIDRVTANRLVVTTADIADAAIKSAHIDNAQITRAKIADGAIDRALIDTAAIGTTQIADGSITDAKIVDLTANKITAGVLSTERLIIRDSVNPELSLIYEINNITGALQAVQGDTVNGEVLTERSITKDKIVAKSITSEEIAAKSITANEMVANTITAASGVIADAAITNAMISNLDAGKITTGTLDANRVSLKFGGKNIVINSNFSKTKEAYPKRDEPQWSLYWRFINGWQVKAASEQSSTSFEQGWLYTARRFWQFSYEPAIHVKSETSPAHYAEEDDQNPDEGGYPVLPGEVYTLSVLALAEQWSANSRLKLAYSPGNLAHTVHDIFAAPLMANDPNYKTGAVLSDKTYTLNQLEAWNGIDGTPYHVDYVDFRPTRFWVTFTVPEDMIWDNKLNLIFLDNRSSSTDMSLYSEVQLERGNVVTDWSPAQEDLISSGVSYQGITIDTIDGLVSEAVINGKSVSVKLNSVDGLSFYDGEDYRGGMAVRDGELALLTDFIGTPDNPYHFAKFDKHNPYGSGSEFSILKFFARQGAQNTAAGFLDISGRVNSLDNSQAYISNTNGNAVIDITAGNAPYETPIGSSWIQLENLNADNTAHIWLHAINATEDEASIRLWSQTNPYIEFSVDKEEVGRFDSSGLKINGHTVWHAGNDGTGSGLDADTLDGLHGTSYMPAVTQLVNGKDMNTVTATGFYCGYNMTNAAVTGISTFIVNHYSPDWIDQIQITTSATPQMYMRSRHSGTTWGAWHTVWSSANLTKSEFAAAEHEHHYAPSTGSAFYVNRNADGSCIQIPAPANVHVNRASGFYMAYNITNSPTADWWFFVYMKLDANACTVFAFPCNSASTPRWKRFTSGTWTSWANMDVSV